MSLNKIEDLKSRVFGKGAGDEDRIIESLCVVMREFGYTLEEVKKIPLPTLRYLMKLLEKESEKMNKGMKNPSRGRI